MARRTSREQSYFVVKDNALIQRARYSMTLQQQKMLLYMISKIKPNEPESKEYTISIRDYCRCCGIDYNNGGNYAYIKETLKNIADKSMWLCLPSGTETLLRWLDRVRINKQSGNITYTFHEDMLPFLLNLQDRYTQYCFQDILPMKSTYSIRIYELLRSYFNLRKPITFSLDELRHKLNCEKYPRFSNFKQKVLDVAVEEINEHTDLFVEYKLEKIESRSYNRITFFVQSKWENYVDSLD